MAIRKPKIILDCDDVLFDCNRYAVKMLNETSGTNYSINEISCWGPLGNGLDRRLKFFSDPAFVESQPVYEGAVEFVEYLSEFADIVLATDVPEQCMGVREKRIRENFPRVSDIRIGKDKSVISGDYMLDDSVEHIKASSAKIPVIFRQPWNKREKKYRSVRTYVEFVRLIHDIEVLVYG